MSELNTKTLSELTTVDSLLNTDTVLIESGGRMKKVSPSAIGGEGSGGGGSVLVIEAIANETGATILNKTWQEIYDAFTNDTACFVRNYNDMFLVSCVNLRFISSSRVEFYIDLVDFRSEDTYNRFTVTVSDSNGYPSWED